MDNPKAYTMVVLGAVSILEMRVDLGSTTTTVGQLSDETLLTRIVQGDVTALDILYDRYAPMILGIALKITGDQPLAEEVLKETFWQVWQSAPTYPSQSGRFTSWLFRTARRLAMEADRSVSIARDR
jgi:RNA polymerase sigma-70 factor (ECF subfamily)